MNEVLFIIQARTSSKRLPKKILLKASRKSLFEHLLKRLDKLKKKGLVCVATTKKKEDDILVQISKKKNFFTFRGSEKNVLKRFYDCNRIFQRSIIVRITADCPLIDIKYVEKLLNKFLKSNYDYMSNFGHKYLPEGFCCEIFKSNSLNQAFKETKSRFHKEHVTSYIWSNPKKFKIFHDKGNKKRSIKNIRLTLDYFEDYILIKNIIEYFNDKKSYYDLEDIFKFLNQNKSLLDLNKKYILKHWNKYQKKRDKFEKHN